MTGVGAAGPRLHVLGEFRATYSGEPLTVSQPGQRVLGCLAVMHRDRPVRRTVIADRLWPDAPPDRAASPLRSVLWRLPRPRGRRLVDSGPGTVTLRREVEVDLWESERLATSLCTPADGGVARAEDLAPLEEDLLPDWDEEWLLAEREAHRQLRLHALERLAATRCDDGSYTAALAAGLRAVRSEPLRESAHRLVIAVHLAEGNFAEAVRQYDGYRRLLATELGISPSPAIARLVGPLLGRPIDSAGR